MKLRNILPKLMRLEPISPNKLNEIIANNRVTVLDVNARKSWEKTRVPGALHLNPAKYDQNDLPADKESAIVFYCSNPMCRKAPNAARRAEKMGYTNVKVMSAGISGWVSAGMPVSSDT